MMYGITQQQKRVLDFIEKFVKERCFAPSYRDIAIGLGYKSPSGVKQLVDQLESRGRIKKGRKAHSIEVIRGG